MKLRMALCAIVSLAGRLGNLTQYQAQNEPASQQVAKKKGTAHSNNFLSMRWNLRSSMDRSGFSGFA